MIYWLAGRRDCCEVLTFYRIQYIERLTHSQMRNCLILIHTPSILSSLILVISRPLEKAKNKIAEKRKPLRKKMKEKLTWRQLLARTFSRTPDAVQRVVKGIVKKKSNTNKRVQLFNTVRWSSDNLNQARINCSRIKGWFECYFRDDLLC